MTTVRRRYRQPPVVEALAELYFEGSAWDVTAPGSFYEQVKDRFPKKEQRGPVAFEVEVRPEGANARMSAGGDRALFKNEDETRLVQVAADILVVNQLRPYPHYEAWRNVLLEMLPVYRDIAQPTSVTRLGMRYINRVDLGLPFLLMEEYFRVYPQMPEEIGRAHGDFLVRLQLPAKIPGHSILLTFGKAPSEDLAVQAFVLDLYDVISLRAPNSFDTIEQRLNEAHENIEWVFEHTITDATRAAFGEVTGDLR